MSSNASLIELDEQAREAALDVQRSFIVQAPAGSGKTELLIQRYLKLLATVENPEEVLAITFTKKAAAEMRHRVLEALKARLRGETPAEAHQLVTAAAADQVLQRDSALSWELIANPARLRIQTLDSLNAAISRMQPISAGSGSAHNSVVADSEMHAMYRQAAFLTLDQLTDDASTIAAAVTEVLQHLDNNTGLFGGYVARMLASRDQWLPIVGSGQLSQNDADELRERFEHNLETAVLRVLADLQRTVPPIVRELLVPLAQHAAKNLVDDDKADQPIAALADMEQLPGAGPDDVSTWQSLAELLLTREGQFRKTVNKNQGFPPKDDGQKQGMLELLANLVGHDDFRVQLHAARSLPATRYSEEQWSVLLALFRLLPLAVTELKRLFSERGITDYIEVALSAANALGSADEPGDVALLLDYQLRHLLIDEMQDTASAQYSMLESLTGGWQDGDGRTMFCVGDPMQSIYRFRNAEVGQFLLAKENGIGSIALAPLTLRRNFRSGEHLVDWFNAVFPDVLAATDDAAQSAVAYAASVAVPQHAGAGDCQTHPLFGNDADTEARRGSKLIHQILEEHPDDTMAVLVRSRTQLSRLLAELRRAGIAYRAVEIDRLTDLPEIIDILALTRALVHHGDRLAWLAVLRAPWAGLTWADLHTLVLHAPADATMLELLTDAARVSELSEHGRDAVQRLLTALEPGLRGNRVSSLRDLLEKLWLALGGPGNLNDTSNVVNVYRYLDVLEGLEQAGTLPDVARLEAALDLEHVSSDSDARLQVMTMHRAKGLQFEHVLLYGLGHAPRPQETTVLNWIDVPDASGNVERIVSPVGPRADLEKDPLYQFVQRAEAVKNRHELGRLLYVACTRAQKTLHLMGHVGLSKDGAEFRAPPGNTLLALLWPFVEADFARVFEPADAAPATSSQSGWTQPLLRRFERPWELPEPVPLLPDDGRELIEDPQTEVEFYWVGSEARVAGTLTHRWLQLIADQRVAGALSELPDVAATTLQWLHGTGIRGETATTISQRVALALQQMFADEIGRWLLTGQGKAELALSGVIDGEITSVVLDRVRIDDAGIHWIVDYKTSTHEGGNLDSFIQAEIDRYTPQLARYQALYQNYADVETRCALYFPLLQKFVELDL